MVYLTVLLALIYALYDRDIIFTVTCFSVLLAYLIIKTKKAFNSLFSFLLISVILIYFCGSFFHLFSPELEYDSFLHFFSGLVVSLLAGALFYKKLKGRNLFLIIILSGILIGVGWEVFEVTAGQFVPQDLVGDIDDILPDLVADTVGAFLAALLAPVIFKKK